jgi:hypothetical protein
MRKQPGIMETKEKATSCANLAKRVLRLVLFGLRHSRRRLARGSDERLRKRRAESEETRRKSVEESKERNKDKKHHRDCA